MLIVAKSGRGMPDGPLLSRTGNFAALRNLLLQDEGVFAHQTLFLGNDYAKIDLQPAFGHGYVEFISVAENFFVVISELDFNADCAFRYLGENWIRFSFTLSGTTSLMFDGRDTTNIGRQMSHLMLHPEGIVHSDHYYAGTQLRWVSILCRKEHLIDTLGFDPEVFPAELKRFLAYGEPTLFLNQRPINMAMHRCVTEIFRKPPVVALRPLYLKGKAYEALYTFLEDFAVATPPRIRAGGLTQRDIDRLHEVRSILEAEIGSEIGLGPLARRVGLNRSKLSQGFHALFGTTLLDYTKVRRLTAAYELLRDTDLSVAQVAERCGYRHMSSFSAAFKLQFNVSPSEMRASQRWRASAPPTASPRLKLPKK